MGMFPYFLSRSSYFRQCWLAPWESQLEETILEIDTAQHNSGRWNHLFGCMGCGNTVLFLTKSLFESSQMGWSTFLCYSPCLLFSGCSSHYSLPVANHRSLLSVHFRSNMDMDSHMWSLICFYFLEWSVKLSFQNSVQCDPYSHSPQNFNYEKLWFYTHQNYF